MEAHRLLCICLLLCVALMDDCNKPSSAAVELTLVALQIPHTNSYLVATNKVNGCDPQSKRTCKPCDKQNCEAALGGAANLELLCIPCNCAIEYDTCSLSYTTSGAKAVANVSTSGKYYACPVSGVLYVFREGTTASSFPFFLPRSTADSCTYSGCDCLLNAVLPSPLFRPPLRPTSTSRIADSTNVRDSLF